MLSANDNQHVRFGIMIRVVISFFVLCTLLSVKVHADTTARARKLINSQGCKACHTLEGDGGNLSVSFETMREKLSRAEIRGKLVNPEKQHGNDKIKDFSHLDSDDINALIEFIQPQPR